MHLRELACVAFPNHKCGGRDVLPTLVVQHHNRLTLLFYVILNEAGQCASILRIANFSHEIAPAALNQDYFGLVQARQWLTRELILVSQEVKLSLHLQVGANVAETTWLVQNLDVEA